MPLRIKPNRNRRQYDENASAQAVASFKNGMHYKVIVIFAYNLLQCFFYVKYTCDINGHAVICW